MTNSNKQPSATWQTGKNICDALWFWPIRSTAWKHDGIHN